MIGPTPNHHSDAGDDQHEQQHHEQRRGRSRAAAATSSHARSRQVIGSAAQIRSRWTGPGVAPVGRYGDGTGEPSTSAGHPPVPVRQPPGRGQGHQQDRDARPRSRRATPPTASRTNSTSAGTASSSCRAAYPVIRSRPAPRHRSQCRPIRATGADSGPRHHLRVGVLALLTRAGATHEAGASPDLPVRGARHDHPPAPCPGCRSAPRAGAPPTRGARSAPGSPSSSSRVARAALVPTQQTTDADYRLGESGRADAMTAAGHLADDQVESVLVTPATAAAPSTAARPSSVAAQLKRRPRAASAASRR